MKNQEQQRTIATKNALLQAALKEFATAGYEGASLRNIGETANINHRLIQHHFGSKLDLWRATATSAFNEFEQRIETRLTGLEGVSESETIRLVLREFILHSAQFPDLNNFMLQANRSPDRMSWIVNTLIKPSRFSYFEQIQRAQELGLFVAGNPQLLWYIFAGAATAIFAFHEEFSQISGQDPHAEETIAELEKTVLGLFLKSEKEE